MAENIGKAGHVTTSDGVRLHYLEAGSGKPLVMIPGWSQTAAQYKYQIARLHDRYRLIALDMRGHGESDKPAFGYKIARFSKDLHDALVALDLREVTLLGHSIGCSVIWSYCDLFGAERLAKLILVDQMPAFSPTRHGHRRNWKRLGLSSQRKPCMTRAMRWPVRTVWRPRRVSLAGWSPARCPMRKRPG
jgi:pimeloyl-ACP methyl ester carboxylesterase